MHGLGPSRRHDCRRDNPLGIKPDQERRKNQTAQSGALRHESAHQRGCGIGLGASREVRHCQWGNVTVTHELMVGKDHCLRTTS